MGEARLDGSGENPFIVGAAGSIFVDGVSDEEAIDSCKVDAAGAKDIANASECGVSGLLR